MKDKREIPYCNIDCSKQCLQHGTMETKVKGNSKLSWLLLVVVLGSGLWQNKSLSAYQKDVNGKINVSHTQLALNTEFNKNQKLINEKIVKSLERIDKNQIRIENKIDNYLKWQHNN